MSEIVKVAELFCDAVRKHGKRKIIKAIQNVHYQKISDSSQLIIDYILESVCSFYGTKPLEIIKQNVLSENLECREMCILLISKSTNLTQAQISKQFNLKGNYETSNVLKKFKHKNPKIKQDALFLERYDKLKPLVDNFIESL